MATAKPAWRRNYATYYRALPGLLDAAPADRRSAFLLRHAAGIDSLCHLPAFAAFLSGAGESDLAAASGLPVAMGRIKNDAACFGIADEEDRLEKTWDKLGVRMKAAGLSTAGLTAALASLRKRIVAAKRCDAIPEPMPEQPDGLIDRLLDLREANPEKTPSWVREYVSGSLSKIEAWHPKDACRLCVFFGKAELYLSLLGLTPDEEQAMVAERYLRFLEASPEYLDPPSAWLSRFEPLLKLLRTPSQGEEEKLKDLKSRGYVLNFLPSKDAAHLREMFMQSPNPVIAAYLEAESVVPVPYRAPAAQ